MFWNNILDIYSFFGYITEVRSVIKNCFTEFHDWITEFLAILWIIKVRKFRDTGKFQITIQWEQIKRHFKCFYTRFTLLLHWFVQWFMYVVSYKNMKDLNMQLRFLRAKKCLELNRFIKMFTFAITNISRCRWSFRPCFVRNT